MPNAANWAVSTPDEQSYRVRILYCGRCKVAVQSHSPACTRCGHVNALPPVDLVRYRHRVKARVKRQRYYADRDGDWE